MSHNEWRFPGFLGNKSVSYVKYTEAVCKLMVISQKSYEYFVGYLFCTNLRSILLLYFSLRELSVTNIICIIIFSFTNNFL